MKPDRPFIKLRKRVEELENMLKDVLATHDATAVNWGDSLGCMIIKQLDDSIKDVLGLARYRK